MKSAKFMVWLQFLLIVGCASPAVKLSNFAQANQLLENRVKSEKFEHVVYRSGGKTHAGFNNGGGTVEGGMIPGKPLHVYLEGDGLPWILRFFRTRDPTPRRALMLQLMTLDTEQSFYIGRPCYNGLANSDGCSSSLWTSARYSPAVVNSMVAVLRKEIWKLNPTHVDLFGHSGGGALALLIAEQVPQVRRIVTLAGNIDTDGWIRYHGYSPLYTSLNPAARAALSESIDQIHYFGNSDKNIPPKLNIAWVSAQNNAIGIVANGFTHSCCWKAIWPTILKALDRGKPYRLPGKVFKWAVSDRPITWRDSQ